MVGSRHPCSSSHLVPHQRWRNLLTTYPSMWRLHQPAQETDLAGKKHRERGKKIDHVFPTAKSDLCRCPHQTPVSSRRHGQEDGGWSRQEQVAGRKGYEGLVWLKLSTAGTNEPGDGSLAWTGVSGWGATPPRTALVPGPPCWHHLQAFKVSETDNTVTASPPSHCLIVLYLLLFIITAGHICINNDSLGITVQTQRTEG